MSVEYNGTSVVQVTPFLNHFVSYKLVTSFSQDLAKHGPSSLFTPDNSSSFRWSQAGASKDGIGLNNNRVYGAINGTSLVGPGTLADQANLRFYQRLKNVVDVSTAGLAGATNLGGLQTTAGTGFNGGGPLLTAASAATVGRARFSDNAGAAAARVYYWDILAKIRLKDICPFFATFTELLWNTIF